MNKESYLFDRIRWGAAIFLIFHISLLFILFLQDWKTEKMKWFILFLGVLYVILLYAAYQLIYRPLKVNSRIKAAFARGDSYEDIYHMPYLLNEEEQNMLRRFYALLDKSELITVSKKKSEYLALQNQINPHFLYNTMDMINWMAQQGRTSEVCNAVQSLSRFYKLTLSRKKGISTIAKEEEHVSIYVHLQNMRYHDSISFISDIPDELMEYQIPKLTLQPVIENSILHGILEKPSKSGTIVLTGWMEDGDIVLLISDDGVGIAPDKLPMILSGEGTSISGGTNIAIYNTHRRLQVLYGADYGLTYSSDVGKGTEVQIRIPAKKDAENK